MEPRLTWNDCDIRSLVEQLDAKRAEICRLLHGSLDTARTREFTDEVLAAGLPL